MCIGVLRMVALPPITNIFLSASTRLRNGSPAANLRLNPSNKASPVTISSTHSVLVAVRAWLAAHRADLV